jgi:hypothetical protein
LLGHVIRLRERALLLGRQMEEVRHDLVNSHFNNGSDAELERLVFDFPGVKLD